MTTRCPGCGGEQRPIALPAAQARTEVVTASVDARTVVRCDPGCSDTRSLLGSALDRALDAGLTFGRGRPDAASCAGCTELLDLPMRATTRSVTVEPPAAAPFTLTFSLPLVRCGGCGADNVPPGLADAVRSSARTACGVPPEQRRGGLLRRLRRRGAPGSPDRP